MLRGGPKVPVSRGLADIPRTLARHSHEHPPVRDVNQEVERRTGRGERIADDLARVIGSWTFVAFQAVLIALWLFVNLVGFLRHWDSYPFHLLNLVLTFQAAFAVPIVLMALNRMTNRDRLAAHKADHVGVQEDEAIKSVMTHLDVEDEQTLPV